MIELNTTTDQLQQCLSLLKQANGFINAVNLAARMQLRGDRETRRRKVRDIVKRLRDGGAWIVAQNPEGYCLTNDSDIWKQYQEGRKIDAKTILGNAYRHQKMLTDKTGQGMLFQVLGTAMGILR